MSKENSLKVYVKVIVTFTEEGQMRPRMVMWEDGHKYKIDRVIDIKQAAAMRCGGQGDRYTVRIDNKETYLYFERSTSLTGDNVGRWFVERRAS